MSRGSPAGSPEPIALIPAAGFAKRLGELPCSKELLPLGWSPERRPHSGEIPPGKPLTAHLLERLALGGIRRALVVTRREKSDIARQLGSGERWGLKLEYLYVAPTASTPATLDAAYDHVHGATVALGFPDIIFTPEDAYGEVIEERRLRGADVALGLFPSDQPESSDMVELRPDGTVQRLVIKQPDRGLTHTWSIAVWSPTFTEYLHERLRHPTDRADELYVGNVLQAAMEDGLSVATRVFTRGASVDLGTPRVLAQPPDWVLEL